jgi:hypothetical protein
MELYLYSPIYLHVVDTETLHVPAKIYSVLLKTFWIRM